MSGRWYELTLTPPVKKEQKSVQVYFPGASSGPPATGVTTASGGTKKQWGSNLGGIYNPQAQNIEFDAIISPYDEPVGGSSVTIEGVDLADLTQAHQYAGYGLQLKAGMKDGLPLSADQGPPGLILQGTVVQGIGNWVGTEMSLALIIVPGVPYDYKAPGNLVLNWRAGKTLASALTTTFQSAYPSLVPTITISPQLVLGHDEVSFHGSLSELAHTVKRITQPIAVVPGYLGVNISIVGNKIIATDFTQAPARAPVQIGFNDLVGQPSWIAPATIQITTVLRSDVAFGDQILMPQLPAYGPGLVTTSPTLPNAYQNFQPSFSGIFNVSQVRQIGNYRAPEGQQWVTVINAIAVTSVAEPQP